MSGVKTAEDIRNMPVEEKRRLAEKITAVLIHLLEEQENVKIEYHLEYDDDLEEKPV